MLKNSGLSIILKNIQNISPFFFVRLNLLVSLRGQYDKTKTNQHETFNHSRPNHCNSFILFNYLNH